MHNVLHCLLFENDWSLILQESIALYGSNGITDEMCLEVLLKIPVTLPTTSKVCVIWGYSAMQRMLSFRNAMCDRATNLCRNVQTHLSSDLRKVLDGVNNQRICPAQALMTLLDMIGWWLYHLHSLVCFVIFLHDPCIADFPCHFCTVPLEVLLMFSWITMSSTNVPKNLRISGLSMVTW